MIVSDFLSTIFASEVILPADVGDVEPVRHSEFGTLMMQIADLHTNGDQILWMKDAIGGFEFDAVETRMYCPDGLRPGTYLDSTVGFSFSLTREIPPGGVLVYHYDQDSNDVTGVDTFPAPASTELIEHTGFRQNGRGARQLTNMAEAVNFNDPYRAIRGSGNYLQSALNKYLNSDAPAGQWWYPSHVFDRPPSYADRPGFLAGFEKSFLDKIVTYEPICASNRRFEMEMRINSSYTVPSKFFLPSYSELSGQANNNVMEGSRWELAENRENLRKTNLLNGERTWYWQRSCHPDVSYDAFGVDTDGDPNDGGWACIPSGALAAACVIRA